jgi:hypothetical protein
MLKWNAYCLVLDQIGRRAKQEPQGATRGATRGMMKIYLLMALIGAIAAMSHLKLARKAPEHEA